MKYFGFSVSPVSTMTEYDRRLIAAAGATGEGPFLYSSAEATPVMTENLARLITRLEAGEPPADKAPSTSK